MAYQQITFLQLRNALALRLSDSGKVFWSDTELKLHIQDALRFWNILTADNKQNYALSVSSANVYYDLQTISGSPRKSTLQDRDVFTRITYSLLEPPSNVAAVTTGQFSQDEIIQAVQRKRDEFLFRTACTSTVRSLAVTANTATLNLPQTVIQARRAYWLPVQLVGAPSTAFPLFKSDEYATAAYQANAVSTPGTPQTFSAGMEPPLTLELVPAPDRIGAIECLTVESQGILSPLAATTLLIPSDFVPGLFWGALADLLMITLEAQDIPRAQYAKQRFDEFVALSQVYPFVFGARVNGVPIFCDCVESLDVWSTSWRTANSNPSILAISGQNLIAFPTSVAMQIVLFLCANANIPVNDGDFIQLDQSVIDVILDESASVAQFKLGGAEAANAASLHANIIRLAAQRNSKVRAMSVFRDILYERTQRENQITLAEISNA